MGGLATAVDRHVPQVAVDSGHHSDRQLASNQHRARLDVQLQEGSHSRGLQELNPTPDRLHVRPRRRHVFPHSLIGVETATLEISLGQEAKHRIDVELLDPRVIVTLGRHAAGHLLESDAPLGKLRGRVHHFRGRKVVVTYHPAFLLRSPHMKKECWKDIQLVMAELDLPLPGGG